MQKGLLAHADKLWVLQLLVRSGGFKQAALEAGVTTSAVSQTVTTLEKVFGKSLVVRERGHAAPTPFCSQLLEKAAPAFVILRSIEEGALEKPEARLTVSKLRIGAYESIAVNVVPELYSRLDRKYPSLKLLVKTGRSGVLASMVRSGDLDLALVIENDLIRNLEVDVLARDGLGLFVNPSHPVFDRGWEAISEYKLGGLTPGKDGFPRYYSKFLKSLGSRAQVQIECDSFETLRALAVRGAAICVLPKRVANRSAQDLRALELPEGAKDGLHDTCLVSRRSLDPAAKAALIQELSDILGPSTR